LHLNYWLILKTLCILQGLIALGVSITVYRVAKTPLGMRLLLIGILMLVQATASFLAYSKWAEMGLGPEVAIPLLAVHAAALAVTALLYDAVRV
jgi:hypothetical protein